MSEMVGFIGLGHLGLPVATNLLNAGYPLRVYNRTVSKAESLVAQGAQLATRPVDAVTTGGIVVTIVWDDGALESVVRSGDPRAPSGSPARGVRAGDTPPIVTRGTRWLPTPSADIPRSRCAW
jgi:3-hydroxyisobutyrate dehydrogenase-like beta-hydroxyacid dehydrogenase